MPAQSRNLLAFLTLGLLTLATLLTGCSREQKGGPEQPNQRPVLRFASSSEHHTMDPQQMTWLHDVRIARSLYQPLVVHKMPGLELEAGSAASWDIDDQGLVYTFKIRPEAKWSNGDPVLAEHFVFGWRRAITPDFAADYSQLLFSIKGARDFYDWRTQQLTEYAKRPGGEKSLEAAEQLWEEAQQYFAENVGIRAIDDQTLEVTLEQSTPYFLELCSFSTFMPNHPASVTESMSFQAETGYAEVDAAYWSDPSRLVTNGAYQLKDRRFKEYTELSPNPHYWDKENVKNGGIMERVVGEPQTALIAYSNGQFDWLPDMPSASSLTADLVAQGREDVHVTPAAGTYFYNFNCTPTRKDGSKNPLADPRVRRALSMCINREQIVDQVTRMGQPIAKTFVPVDSIPGYTAPEFAGVKYDPEQARQLLAEAGYPDGKGLEGMSFFYNTGHGHEDIAQVITKAWSEELGISVPLEGVESREFGDRLRSGDYDIARASWFGDYRDPTTFLDKFRKDNGNNDANYANDAFDSLMEEAAAADDSETRMQRLAEAEALVLTEQPIAPIFYYVIVDVYDEGKVTGISPNMWNIRRLEHVSVKGSSSDTAKMP